MKAFLRLAILSSIVSNCSTNTNAQTIKSSTTFCNPVDIPYMFQPDGKYRSAADPVIVLYKNKYWLFVSKNDGYYVSNDLVQWRFVKGVGYPTEIFAPTVVEMDSKLYLTTGSGKDAGTFVTDKPELGIWTRVSHHKRGVSDPATFLDDDGRLYLYDGCSDKTPIKVALLDSSRFLDKATPYDLFGGNPQLYGWEVSGDNNEIVKRTPWIEGSWMNKINGKYYLQYAAPGTQYSSYADGVYIGDNPLGPFQYAPYSPFSFKPTGFITGAGHSATFEDRNKNYWHVATASISIRHSFERRILLLPTGVLPDGQLVTNSYLGDYPQYATIKGEDGWKDNRTNWMLLSYNKKATASSVLPSSGLANYNVSNACDENIRTWWSAATSDAGEWLQVDLKQICKVNAIQVNFADQDANLENTFANDSYQYQVFASADGKKWKSIVDKRFNTKESPHDYTQLDHSIDVRYLKIVNTHMPVGAKFSLSDFRIFGIAPGQNPTIVTNTKAIRNLSDQRQVDVSWDAVKDADFYIIRYGIAPDKLYSNYQVYNANNFTIRSLNVGVPYYFIVDAINSHGITKGKNIVAIQ